MMMVGLPGSGKSTLAKDIKDTYHGTIFSSDSIRKELLVQKSVWIRIKKYFKRFIEELRTSDRASWGQAVVQFMMHVISVKKRMAFLRELKRLIAKKFAILYGLHIK